MLVFVKRCSVAVTAAVTAISAAGNATAEMVSTANILLLLLLLLLHQLHLQISNPFYELIQKNATFELIQTLMLLQNL